VSTKTVAIIGAVVLAVLLLPLVLGGNKVTMANYDKIQMGMSYDDVLSILGEGATGAEAQEAMNRFRGQLPPMPRGPEQPPPRPGNMGQGRPGGGPEGQFGGGPGGPGGGRGGPPGGGPGGPGGGRGGPPLGGPGGGPGGPPPGGPGGGPPPGGRPPGMPGGIQMPDMDRRRAMMNMEFYVWLKSDEEVIVLGFSNDKVMMKSQSGIGENPSQEIDGFGKMPLPGMPPPR